MFRCADRIEATLLEPNLLALRYSSTRSTAIHRRSSRSATAPVVFDPANGSHDIGRVGEQLDEELGQGGGEAGGVDFLAGGFAALGVEVVGGVVAELEQIGGGLRLHSADA